MAYKKKLDYIYFDYEHVCIIITQIILHYAWAVLISEKIL